MFEDSLMSQGTDSIAKRGVEHHDFVVRATGRLIGILI